MGTLDAGIGETHLKTILMTLNFPPIRRSSFKRREREVGLAVEHVSKKSCTNTVMKERKIAVENGAVPDDKGLVGIQCSYDMGWQKRGRGFNSLTGHGAVMGLKSGKVMGCSSRNKDVDFATVLRGKKMEFTQKNMIVVKTIGALQKLWRQMLHANFLKKHQSVKFSS